MRAASPSAPASDQPGLDWTESRGRSLAAYRLQALKGYASVSGAPAPQRSSTLPSGSDLARSSVLRGGVAQGMVTGRDQRFMGQEGWQGKSAHHFKGEEWVSGVVVAPLPLTAEDTLSLRNQTPCDHILLGRRPVQSPLRTARTYWQVANTLPSCDLPWGSPRQGMPAHGVPSDHRPDGLRDMTPSPLMGYGIEPFLGPAPGISVFSPSPRATAVVAQDENDIEFVWSKRDVGKENVTAPGLTKAPPRQCTEQDAMVPAMNRECRAQQKQRQGKWGSRNLGAIILRVRQMFASV